MTSLPSPPGAQERALYYAGLPSHPPLVARSSTFVWEEPRGPEAYPRKKYLLNVGGHPIADLMDNIMPNIFETLKSKSISWTSIDVVRIAYKDSKERPPVILWIGVKPSSLSGEDGVHVLLLGRMSWSSMGLVMSSVRSESHWYTVLDH